MITDEQLAELLRYDFSKGHEEFKEALLARCLALGDVDGDGTGEDDVRELDDDDLPLLAAAGDATTAGRRERDLDSLRPSPEPHPV